MQITLKDISNYLEGNYNFFNKEHLPAHIEEQVRLRAFLCSDCLQQGKCSHCGCKTPHMFYASHKIDAQHKWAEFMNEAQWNSLKNNIDLYVAYFKQYSESIQDGSRESDNSTTVIPNNS